MAYEVGIPPEDSELARWLMEELQKIEEVLINIEERLEALETP